MKEQFFLTYTNSEVPALLDSWVTNKMPVKITEPQKNCFLYCLKNLTYLSVELLSTCQGFSLLCKTVCR